MTISLVVIDYLLSSLGHKPYANFGLIFSSFDCLFTLTALAYVPELFFSAEFYYPRLDPPHATWTPRLGFYISHSDANLAIAT